MRTSAQPHPPLPASLQVLLISAWVGLGGCSYLETQLQRTAPADGRITLGWQERVQLRSRDLVNYKCEANYFLRCDGEGAATLSCTCSLR
jgi:hypothetical protein